MFFADLYMVYFFKTLVCWFKFWGSENWPTMEAVVTDRPNISSGASGCPIVEISYKYRVDGELHTGLQEESFLLSNSARDFAALFERDANVAIRVKPGRPEVSTLCRVDQISGRSGTAITVGN
jgi:hypothetical protein